MRLIKELVVFNELKLTLHYIKITAAAPDQTVCLFWANIVN